MELLWWVITIVLFAVGLIGTIAPVLPGTTIILAAAVIHRIMLGPEKSIGWRTIVVLVLLTLATYAIRFSRRLFWREILWCDQVGHVRRDSRRTSRTVLRYPPVCLSVRLSARLLVNSSLGKRMIDAGRAGWGSLLGNLGAMVGKLVIALAMIAIFLPDCANAVLNEAVGIGNGCPNRMAGGALLYEPFFLMFRGFKISVLC